MHCFHSAKHNFQQNSVRQSVAWIGQEVGIILDRPYIYLLIYGRNVIKQREDKMKPKGNRYLI